MNQPRMGDIVGVVIAERDAHVKQELIYDVPAVVTEYFGLIAEDGDVPEHWSVAVTTIATPHRDAVIYAHINLWPNRTDGAEVSAASGTPQYAYVRPETVDTLSDLDS